MSGRSMALVIMHTLLTISAIAAVQTNGYIEGAAAAQGQVVEREFIVEGMHCASCLVTVRVAAAITKAGYPARPAAENPKATR